MDTNGGAQRTVWEILLKMETFKYQAGEQDQGAVALILDVATASERVGLPVVWVSATHFNFSRTILRVLCCGYFEHQRRVQFEGCVAITAILSGSKWSRLPLHIVLQGALSEVTQIFPLLKLRVFVDDITALLKGKKKGVGGVGGESFETFEERRGGGLGAVDR